jgi:hypothetical protein
MRPWIGRIRPTSLTNDLSSRLFWLVFLIATGASQYAVIVKRPLSDWKYWALVTLALTVQCTLLTTIARKLALITKKGLSLPATSLVFAVVVLVPVLIYLDATLIISSGTHIDEAIRYLLGGESLYQQLTVMGIPDLIWNLLVVFAAVPVAGFAIGAFYRRYVARSDRSQSWSNDWRTLLALLLAHVAISIISGKVLSYEDWSCLGRLALHSKSLGPSPVVLTVNGALRKQAPLDTQSTLPATNGALAKKPNIYLFIVETLRPDFITPEVTPYISDFQTKNIGFTEARSVGNQTYLSHYSILTGELPTSMLASFREAEGSAGLRILRKAGYKIVSIAGDLEFSGIGQAVFGQNRKLADVFENHGIPAHDYKTVDEQVFKSVRDFHQRHLPKDGHVFIITIDAAHFAYKVPPGFPHKFRPYAEVYDPNPANQTPEFVAKLKNSYRNSLSYVDSVFARYLSLIRQYGDYESSLIALVGDHGDEIGEHGGFGHGGSLVEEKLKIGMAMKIPGISKREIRDFVSGADIMPTLLEAIGVPAVSAFAGRSVFTPAGYAVSFQGTGGISKGLTLFTINNGRHKATLALSNFDEPQHSSALRVLSISNQHDVPVAQNYSKGRFARAFANEFGQILNDPKFGAFSVPELERAPAEDAAATFPDH